jgi:hypothetical protein
MGQEDRVPLAIQRTNRTGAGLMTLLLARVASLALSSAAEALTIMPTFGTGAMGNASVMGAIDSAITTIDGLYSNNVTIPVTFTFTPATNAMGNPTYLLQTAQSFYTGPYGGAGGYVSLLQADSAANPQNTVLATAIANLPSGNNSNGALPMVLDGAQLTMLGVPRADNATININSAWQSTSTPFSFTRPVSSSQFDAIGGLEHELDEVLGGGGAGSALNNFPGDVGSTDLYRYSAPGVPSLSTSAASSYFSINGGVTPIVMFNQGNSPGCSGGDFGDFSPPGTGAGQRIQNACNSTGQDEAYTTSSPEFTMEESIGWNPQQATVPAPLIGRGLPVFLAIGGLLFGAKLLQRSRRETIA